MIVKPAISIILSKHGLADGTLSIQLNRFIQSILDQSFFDFELIVYGYSEHDKLGLNLNDYRIKFVLPELENQGLIGKYISGDFIFFYENLDELESDIFGRLYDFFVSLQSFNIKVGAVLYKDQLLVCRERLNLVGLQDPSLVDFNSGKMIQSLLVSAVFHHTYVFRYRSLSNSYFVCPTFHFLDFTNNLQLINDIKIPSWNFLIIFGSIPVIRKLVSWIIGLRIFSFRLGRKLRKSIA